MNADTKNELRTLVYAAFAIFVSIAFIVTVAFLIFFRSIELPAEQIRAASPMTFIIILVITVFFVVGYEVIRYITVIRPLGRINDTLDKIAAGDFSQRLDTEEIYGKFYPLVRNINKMTDELAYSALMKTDFISNVSHELKTPLAVIGNYGKLLQSEYISEEERMEYARSIILATHRMSELITNILRLNRLENHKLEVKKDTFDLSMQIGECLLQYENIWEEKEIELCVNITDSILIRSDEEMLGFVWNNLFSNAFKFTENGGRVAVSLAEDEKNICFKVEDTGCGMDEETGRHIFEKFYQGDSSHSTQGNGLGLALVKRIIDLVGGEISVSSTLGEGTVFNVRIRRD